MTGTRDVLQFLNNWIPEQIGMPGDRIGLQVGDPDQPVTGVLLCLDVTIPVLEEALRTRSNLIIAHHPFLFHPISRLNSTSPRATIIRHCLVHNLTIVAAHTNLDFIFGGVSTVLAERLGLTGIRLLDPGKGQRRKLEVYIPEEAVDRVQQALSEAGAGRIGHYSNCAFRSAGTGTFLGDEHSNPAIGTAGKPETVNEIRLEMVYPIWKEPAVIQALHQSHPYETPAFQIISTENESVDTGAGAIGTLPSPQSLAQVASRVKHTLGSEGLRFAGNQDQVIQTVAVCGGSGSDLIGKARQAGADCLVTADLKYHQYFESDDRFGLIDSGHYETESVVLEPLKSTLTGAFPGLQVQVTTINTNPVMTIK